MGAANAKSKTLVDIFNSVDVTVGQSVQAACADIIEWREEVKVALKFERDVFLDAAPHLSFSLYRLGLDGAHPTGWNAKSWCKKNKQFTAQGHKAFALLANKIGLRNKDFPREEDRRECDKEWATTIGMLSMMAEFLLEDKRRSYFFFVQEKATLLMEPSAIVGAMDSRLPGFDVAFPYALLHGADGPLFDSTTHKNGDDVGVANVAKDKEFQTANMGAVAVIFSRAAVARFVTMAITNKLPCRADDRNVLHMLEHADLNPVVFAYPKTSGPWHNGMIVPYTTAYVAYDARAPSVSHFAAFADISR